MHLCEHLKVNSVSIFIYTVSQGYNWTEENALKRLPEHMQHMNNQTWVLNHPKEDVALKDANGDKKNIFPKQLHYDKILPSTAKYYEK